MKCTIVIYLVNDSERIDAVSLAQSEHAQLTEHGRELTIRFQDAPPSTPPSRAPNTSPTIPLTATPKPQQTPAPRGLLPAQTRKALTPSDAGIIQSHSQPLLTRSVPRLAARSLSAHPLLAPAGSSDYAQRIPILSPPPPRQRNLHANLE